MSNGKSIFSPAEVELISNISGAYSAPFWDRVLEVSGPLDTVRKTKAVLEVLYSTGHEAEAYNLIMAMFDLIAVETPTAISEIVSYPDAIKRFIAAFLLDIEDLMNDFEYEERESHNI